MIFINNQIFLAVADSTDTLKNALTWSLNNVFAILALLISFLAMWAIWKVVNVLSNSQKEFLYTKHGIPLETIKKDTPSLFNFKGINDALWKLVPLEKEADIDLGSWTTGCHHGGCTSSMALFCSLLCTCIFICLRIKV